jgi:hypothetical protein
MEAIERSIPPDGTQIAQGAGFDPGSHGYNGAINTSFPVYTAELATETALLANYTIVDAHANSWRYTTVQAGTSTGLPRLDC